MKFKIIQSFQSSLHLHYVTLMFLVLLILLKVICALYGFGSTGVLAASLLYCGVCANCVDVIAVLMLLLCWCYCCVDVIAVLMLLVWCCGQAQMDESLDIKQNSCCPECDASLPPQYSMKELRDMTNEAILRMLKAEKVHKHRVGQLSQAQGRKGTQALTE